MEENIEISSDIIINRIKNNEDLYYKNCVINNDLVFSSMIFKFNNEGNILGVEEDYGKHISLIKDKIYSINIKPKIIFYNCIFMGIVSLGKVKLITPEADFILTFEQELSFEESRFIGDVLCFSSTECIFHNKINMKNTKFENEPNIDDCLIRADFTGSTINNVDYYPYKS